MALQGQQDVLDHIVAIHAEEAAFLWMLRQDAVIAPHHVLADLSKLEDRLHAHLDGLRIAGDVGWSICREELSWKEPGELFAASTLAMESSVSARLSLVLDVAAKTPEVAPGLASALGWMELEQVRGVIETLAKADEPLLRRAAIAGAALHRFHPGKVLTEAITRQDPLGLRRALRAVGQLGRADLASLAAAHLTANEPGVRLDAATGVALLVNDPKAVATLQALAAPAGGLPAADRERAAALAVRRLPMSVAGAWLKQLAASPANFRTVAVAAGALGDPKWVPWLLDQMVSLPLARVLGAAFRSITGVDLAYDDLEVKPPADFHSGPTDDPADEDVSMDPDQDLPWPDVTKLREWWRVHRGRLVAGTRYFLGKPITGESLNHVLRTGRQAERAASAVELAIRQPGKPLFNVAAPAARQKRLLGLTK